MAVPLQGQASVVPLVQLPYAASPAQYITYVPYASTAGARSPASPIPPMSRASSSGKLQSPRRSRAMAYATATSPPTTPVAQIPIRVAIPPLTVPLPPTIAARTTLATSTPRTRTTSSSAPVSPLYHPSVTRFCPHCNTRVPTSHPYQQCASCQKPLSAYPQRPPSVVPEADGFAIPGIGGRPAVTQRDLGGGRRTAPTTPMYSPAPPGGYTPTHKM
ncbi:hypothetical protein DACRYDRAFT_21629, partial [Dacryopinax primogenitus]